MSDYRAIPAVDLILKTQKAAELVARYGRTMTLEAIRMVLGELRKHIREDKVAAPDTGAILNYVESRLEQWFQPSLTPVINATGVILHTNLGRAPISRAALQATTALAEGYTTLEYDLEHGSRGSRSVHAENLLKHLTGAEAALVVNNNAAAVLLVLSALAKRKRVIISRTQLVEIGGGFRVPEVMIQSGAKLVEIGTTNRVHITDYQAALEEPAAVVLRAHHSNFKIIGFSVEPALSEIVKIAHAQGVLVVDDLGSGTLLDTSNYGLAHEPMVQESIEAGADLVCFSGDKLLGGPQAGIIVGKASLLAKVKKHPLARAVRADKLCLGALSATLLHYMRDEADREIPVWKMIAATPELVRSRAVYWQSILGTGEIIRGQSTIGGGSLPEETLPTFLLALQVKHPNRFLAKLRQARPPVIARLDEDRVVIDPRTVLPEQDGALLVALQNLLVERHMEL
ncbi:MAG TPA: L-seryl-tRNA(Sec) selenium transferase [Anaerolineaceae bacterium]